MVVCSAFSRRGVAKLLVCDVVQHADELQLSERQQQHHHTVGDLCSSLEASLQQLWHSATVFLYVDQLVSWLSSC